MCFLNAATHRVCRALSLDNNLGLTSVFSLTLLPLDVGNCHQLHSLWRCRTPSCVNSETLEHIFLKDSGWLRLAGTTRVSHHCSMCSFQRQARYREICDKPILPFVLANKLPHAVVSFALLGFLHAIQPTRFAALLKTLQRFFRRTTAAIRNALASSSGPLGGRCLSTTQLWTAMSKRLADCGAEEHLSLPMSCETHPPIQPGTGRAARHFFASVKPCAVLPQRCAETLRNREA